ncbi:amino acid ABC transporter permease [Gordonia rhizosphera]|uniref:Putative amino acid ABC transporter permease protein n=1 Tax=Gordonia rhizosphera NBRC 16068 TaxID=1108045 RepID=K6WLE1_9ACTN|nr:amino acid ABC transporter permease [Gordonia rhizosphera]GAB92967.1 putative amino acid ABC transporter permease protein [Gordonia rhizosphera NBRC 16068]
MTMSMIANLLPGLATTLVLWISVLLIGIPMGLFAGLALQSGPRALRWPIMLVTQIGRGFPALVTLYLVYFGLPELNVTVTGSVALVAAFSLTTASYLAEVFRSAIAAVPGGQREAAMALGVPVWSATTFVVLPQALRMVIAPVLGFAVLVLQGTSLAYSIGVQELLGVAYSEGTMNFDVFDYLLMAGAFYLIAYLLLMWATSAVRRKAMSFQDKRTRVLT